MVRGRETQETQAMDKEQGGQFGLRMSPKKPFLCTIAKASVSGVDKVMPVERQTVADGGN